MNVLVLNCGSSSLKFQVIATDVAAIESNTDRRLAHGQIERIGSEAVVTLRAGEQPAVRRAAPLRDHRAALDELLRWLVSDEPGAPQLGSLGEIHAVGHRVVHGGEKLTRSTLVDQKVIEQIEDCIELAPLHNPADEARNAETSGGREGEIGAAGARVKVFVIPTNEELLIARDTVRCVRDAPRRY